MRVPLITITMLCLAAFTSLAEARGTRHRARHRPPPKQNVTNVVPPFGTTASDDFKDHPVPSGVPMIGPSQHRHLRHAVRHRRR
jgi:hypothetical protein